MTTHRAKHGPSYAELEAEVVRLLKIEVAARRYFSRYVQDEADAAVNCTCGEAQHEDAKSLERALATRTLLATPTIRDLSADLALLAATEPKP